MLNNLLGEKKHNLRLIFLIFIIDDNDLFFFGGGACLRPNEATDECKELSMKF